VSRLTPAIRGHLAAGLVPHCTTTVQVRSVIAPTSASASRATAVRVVTARLLSLFLLLCAALAGCRSAARIAAENDRLREQNIQLQSQNAQLATRNTELLAELQRSSATQGQVTAEIRAVTPHVAGLSIGRLSFVANRETDGQKKVLTVYVHPVDGMGRFTQMVGTVAIHAALLPPDADALTVGRATFSPQQVRDMYRSFLTGTHYVFEVPLTLPGDKSALMESRQVTVRVQYSDGWTGQVFTAERSVDLR
jgi:hypothetical protein